MARRLLVGAGVLGGLFAAAVVAYAAFIALKSPVVPSSPNAASVTENCSPGPCANVQGYVLWVSNVQLANDVVHMTVKFQNSSSSTHASPEDLQLIDASRRASTPITDSTGCNTWTRHEFAKSGDTFGPVNICFRVTNATPPYILRWSPDEGAFCCETDIRIDLS